MSDAARTGAARLVAVVAALGLFILGACGGSPTIVALAASQTADETPTPVSDQGQPVGTDNWILTQNQGTIKGFADKASAAAGDVVSLYVTTPAPSFDVEVYRMGWYDDGAHAGRLVQAARNLPSSVQPGPTVDATTGLISAANWSRSASLTVDGWPTGLYLLKLIAADGDQNYVPLVIRDDAHRHDLLFVHAADTDQAYNYWGGKSLYDFNSTGGVTVGGNKAAVKVSFDRPFDSNGAGFALQSWELDMVRWLEANGYDVSYVSDIDVDQNAQFDAGARAVIEVGHNEYWSRAIRDHLEAASARGTGLGFFTGDTGNWAVRFEDSPLGSDRIEVCYRDAKIDPLTGTDPADVTVAWFQPPLSRPLQQFIGIGTNASVKHSADWVVGNTADVPRLFADTGLQSGDVVPNLVGYEYDGLWTPGSGAQPRNGLHVLGRAHVEPDRTLPANMPPGRPVDESDSVAILPSSGGPIVAVGTIQWSWALDSYGQHDDAHGNHTAVDARIQALTRNIVGVLLGNA